MVIEEADAFHSEVLTISVCLMQTMFQHYAVECGIPFKSDRSMLRQSRIIVFPIILHTFIFLQSG
jgi:hypothetical protein